MRWQNARRHFCKSHLVRSLPLWWNAVEKKSVRMKKMKGRSRKSNCNNDDDRELCVRVLRIRMCWWQNWKWISPLRLNFERWNLRGKQAHTHTRTHSYAFIHLNFRQFFFFYCAAVQLNLCLGAHCNVLNKKLARHLINISDYTEKPHRIRFTMCLWCALCAVCVCPFFRVYRKCEERLIRYHNRRYAFHIMWAVIIYAFMNLWFWTFVCPLVICVCAHYSRPHTLNFKCEIVKLSTLAIELNE